MYVQVIYKLESTIKMQQMIFFFPFDLFGNSVEEMMCQCFNCSKSRDPDAVLCVPLFFLSNFPLC